MDINEAAAQLAKAAHLEKEAKKLRASARKVIVDLWHEKPQAFSFAPDSDSQRTVELPTPAGKIRITTPMSSAVPAHFDNERAADFRRLVADMLPEVPLDSVFDECTSYKFKPDAWLAVAKMTGKAAEMHAVLEPYIVPTVPEAPMSPRVEVA